MLYTHDTVCQKAKQLLGGTSEESKDTRKKQKMNAFSIKYS